MTDIKGKIADEEGNKDDELEPDAEVEISLVDEEEDPIPSTLEDFPEEEELWDGGPTVKQAKQWKAEYGRLVLGTLDNGDHYIIRPLMRSEYRNHIATLEKARNNPNASQGLETLATEEAITMIGLVYPQLDRQQVVNFGPAGFASLVSQQIMEISGFVGVDAVEL